jgi:hyperosmotically inducible periplasmic protein
MRGKALAFLGGVGVGALVMYFLDPSSGDRRRSQARNRVTRAARDTGQAIERGTRDLARRAKGLRASALSRFDPDTPSDDTLAQRVRTSLGRVIAHPAMISISAAAGVVTLSGTVSEEESNGLTASVRRVEGVKDVVDQTSVRMEAVR